MNIFQKIWVAFFQNTHSKWQLRNYRRDRPVKLVIGSSYTYFRGWIHSDVDTLDLLKKDNWGKYFAPNSIDIILAEHVWEHLTPEQGRTGFANCFTFLKPGGFLRIAVPDGFHSSEEYIEKVKPGGSGYGADDHKLLYDFQLITAELEKIGFQVKPLEYFDEQRNFHQNHWNPEEGFIGRSARFDSRNQGGKLVYTSLLVDAVKPLN